MLLLMPLTAQEKDDLELKKKFDLAWIGLQLMFCFIIDYSICIQFYLTLKMASLPEPKMTSFNDLFCLTNSPKPKGIQLKKTAN